MDDSEEVVLRFVLPKGKTEATCSEDLAFAFESSQENGFNPKWISHDETCNICPVKRDVFVMDPFEGQAFNHVCRMKCTVVGPRCLLSCFQKGEPVPELPYPMFTASMRGLIVTATGFDKDQKADIKLKVERMGGIYSNAFHDGITHLVAEVVSGEKYKVAVLKETPVMTIKWIESVWEIGKRENVHATDPQFAKFKCPALYGLNITVSQFSKKDKEALKKSIESHGGVYLPQLDLNQTAILVIPKPEGDKYNHARKWRIPCVSSDWVFDTIERGYCQPTDNYRIETRSGSCSTPTKEGNGHQLSEVSMCSTILMPNEASLSKVNETVNSSNMTLSTNLVTKSCDQLLESLNLSRVRRAGPFLEDCKIFFSGFTDKELEYLDKVVQIANGHRMQQLTSSVTHFVGNQYVAENFTIMKNLGLTPYKVSLQWIVESMHMGHPVQESDFQLSNNDLGLAAADIPKINETIASRKREVIPRKLSLEDEQTHYEDELFAQYRKTSTQTPQGDEFAKPSGVVPKPQPGPATNANEPSVSGSQQTLSQVPPFLEGKLLKLLGFESEMENDLIDWVAEAGGEIGSDNVDYLMTPIIFDVSEDLRKRSRVVVSHLWFEDCLDQGQLVPIEYFHRPIPPRPCAGCSDVVVGITNYTGRERIFIISVAESCKMIAQEIFAKKDKNGAKKSTHLVCAKAEGSKYEAALKWKVPVVTKDWILSCYEEGTCVSEKTFLVGDSQIFTRGRPEPTKSLTRMLGQEDEVTLKGEETSKRENTMERCSPEQSKTADVQTRQLSINVAQTSPAAAAKFISPTRTTATTIAAFELETPNRLDLERLRPKPLDLNSFAPSTPIEAYYADSQPSPSVSKSQKRKREDNEEDLPFYLQGMKTPDTPYGAFLGGNPSPTTRKFWKRQCDELQRYEMTQEEREEWEARIERRKQRRLELEEQSRNEAERPIFQEIPNEIRAQHRQQFLQKMKEKGIPVIGEDPRSFDEIMEEKLNKIGRSWKNLGKKITIVSKQSAEKTSPLQGVIIYVAKKLSTQQAELHSILTSLGGEFRLSYCPEVTHVIFVGKANDTTKEFKVAKADKKFIVSPDWLFMCRDEKKLVDEGLFPHTYNPKLTLPSSLFSQTTSSIAKPRRAMQMLKKSETVVTNNETSQQPEETHSKSEIDLTDELQRMAELMDQPNEESMNRERRSLRLQLASPEREPLKPKDSEESQKCDAIFLKTQPEPTDSQIRWIDPKEEAAKLKLAQRLSAENQNIALASTETQVSFDSMEVPENFTEALMAEDEKDNKENSVPGASATTPPFKKDRRSLRFVMSGISDEERAKFSEFLTSQGIDFDDPACCDSSTTHVIAGKLTRSEKILGCIASGKWLLHPTYTTASMKQGRLLAEAEFEWGNPANRFVTNLMNTTEHKLASASYRWRKIVEDNPRRGIFEGIRAIIHTSENRKGSFKRLLELGKGFVITKAVPPYRDSHGATHCIAELSKLPNSKIDYSALASQGVAVVGPFYLNEFLTSETPPSIESHIIDEFKPHWEKRNH